MREPPVQPFPSVIIPKPSQEHLSVSCLNWQAGPCWLDVGGLHKSLFLTEPGVPYRSEGLP